MTSRINYNNPGESGAFGLPYHYEMVSDQKRVGPFKRAIEKVSKGKRVLESGTGTGILSLIAARAGAKKVYAIERDPVVYKIAKANIEKSPYKRIIKLIHNDTRKVTMRDLDGEKVDVVIAENLSTWQVTEPQVPILNYINKNLATSHAVRIPQKIENVIQFVSAKFDFENLVVLRAPYFEFTGIKKAKNISVPVVASRVDLSKQNSAKVRCALTISITQNGTLNAIRLTSPLDLGGHISFASSDSLMPPVILPLLEDLPVTKGQRVTIKISYGYGADWSNFKIKAILVAQKKGDMK